MPIICNQPYTYWGHVIKLSFPVIHESRFMYRSQQMQNVAITFVQRRLSVFDVGATLYKWYAIVFPTLLGWEYELSKFEKFKLICEFVSTEH